MGILDIFNKVKALIMKACRFILNSDYITSQNDAEYKISVSIPDSFSVPAAQVKEFKTTINIPDSATKDYRCYIESTAFDHAITGVLEGQVKYGNNNLMVSIQRNNSDYTLCVWMPADIVARTYTGTSQVITAHIMTFLDAFQV